MDKVPAAYFLDDFNELRPNQKVSITVTIYEKSMLIIPGSLLDF